MRRARPKKVHKQKLSLSFYPSFVKAVKKFKPADKSLSEFVEDLGKLGLLIHLRICKEVEENAKTEP